MSAPDTAITGDYLYTLTKLKMQLEHQPLPPYPERGTQQQKIWQERMQEQERKFTDLGHSFRESSCASIRQARPRTGGNR
jgi:hypothetical protein